MATLTTQQMINKANLVMISRQLVSENVIENNISLPVEPSQFEEANQNIIFGMVKHYMPGCRIRPASNHITVRLDSQTHQKAKSVRDIVINNTLWAEWFQQNQANVYRRIQEHSSPFQYDGIELRMENEREFINLSLSPDRLPGYRSTGFSRIHESIKRCMRDQTVLADSFDEVNTLVEEERTRRQEARAQRIERERQELVDSVKESLTPTLDKFTSPHSKVTEKFRELMTAWSQENGLEPRYAVPVTPERILPLNKGVRIVKPTTSTNEGWHCVPMFGGYEMPEGFELIQRWGEVTGFDSESERSLGGTQTVVLQGYVYTAFDRHYWESVFPERYDEILEVTNRLQEEAVALVKEEEERAKELERQRREASRLLQDAERLVKEEHEARIREIKESYKASVQTEEEKLREALSQKRQEVKAKLDELFGQGVAETIVTPEPLAQAAPLPPTPPAKRAAAKKEEELKRPVGVYINPKGLPSERYIYVNQQGKMKGFRDKGAAKEFAFADAVLAADRGRYVYDIFDPENRVDTL